MTRMPRHLRTTGRYTLSGVRLMPTTIATSRVDFVDKPGLVMYDLYISDGHVFVASHYMILTLVNMLLERRSDYRHA